MARANLYVHCPWPLPDEPLYGVVARHAAHLGLDNRTRLSIALFGVARLPSIDLPCRVDAFATATSASLGLSGPECLERLTAFNYVSIGLEPEAREALARTMRLGGGNVHNAIGVSSSRVRAPTRLRVCPTCVVEQRRAFGEAYWRRSHQLAGVLCCPDHACWLVDTSVPYRSSGSREYRDAETEVDAALAGHDPTVPAETHVRLARRCRDALLGVPRAPEASAGLVALREGCRAPGGPGAIGEAFVAYAGTDVLERSGCAIDPADPASWLLNILRRPGRACHPFQLVLAEDFAAGAWTSSMPVRRAMARRPHRPTAVRPEDLPRLRAEWNAALDAAPGRSRSVAARACRSVYERLLVADRDWLFSEGRRFNPSPCNERRVDWAERDRTWSEALRSAARSVAASRPAARLTRAALITAAGLPKGTLSCLDRLPNCRRALDDAVETTDEFHARLLIEASNAAPGASATELRARAKLTGPIGPATRQLLAALSRQLNLSGGQGRDASPTAAPPQVAARATLE